MNIQEYIEKISAVIAEYYDNAIITIQTINDIYTKYIGDPKEIVYGKVHIILNEVDFYKWVETEIERQAVCKGTKQNYRSCIKSMKEFSPTLNISQITPNFLYEFDHFLASKGKKINTIGKNMKILRKFINILVDNDMLSKNPFRKYKIRSEKTSKLTLTQSDITKIENNLPSLTGVEYQVMSAFLFSIYSGLRYSDICRINARTDIKTRNKKKWISMTMKKTNLPVKIPIENMFKGAAMKFIKGKTGKLFNLSNNSETNVILKRVLRRIHITKHISFHCARVTTATILLYKNVNITVIQHILGHSSIKTTEIYAKCEDKTINKNIKAAFKK